MRISLPSGGYAELRDVESLRAKDRDWILGRIEDDDGSRMAQIVALKTITAIRVTTTVSVPYLLAGEPFTPSEQPDLLGDLTIPDMGALEGGYMDHVKILFPSNEPKPDSEQATFGPASGS